MAKKKAETGLTLTKGMDVPSVLQKLDEEISSLKTIVETPYKTTGNLENFGDITKETKVENLIRAMSMVSGKEDAYNKAAVRLGLGAAYPSFSVSGGTAADWEQDIKLRIAIVQQDDKFKKLTKFKESMAKFLSEEDQKAMVVAELAAYLSGGSK